MLKILYAAGNNQNAKIALDRFMQAIKGSSSYAIKIAAYKISSPDNLSIDWTLDCLLNMFDPNHITLENDNLNTYFQQVKYFNPDLIISDMEYFTSYIANLLDCTLWQCSSSLINFAVTNKYNVGLFKHYSFSLNRNPVLVQRYINIIDNSNCNFVYSHFGDTENPPILKENFEWIRPYHNVGKISIPCQHNIVARMYSNNKKILELLKNYPDSVIFTDFTDSRYDGIQIKNSSHDEEYLCNLRNCMIFLGEGHTSFLADAFYNGKYSLVLPNFKDTECITNSIFSEQLKLSTTIYGYEDLSPWINKSVISSYNSSVKFLHERLNDL